MPDQFEILARFLERFGDEVEGREVGDPGDDTRARLKQLARGELPEAEQAELFARLNRNPEWIAWLAREVKAMRAGN